MLRTSLCLLVAASTSACAFDDDGDFTFCFSVPCEPSPDSPTLPPPAPLSPFSLEFDDGSYQSTSRLAVGGVMHLDVHVRASAIPEVTSTGDAFALEVTSAERQLTRVDLIGVHEGVGTVRASTPGFEAPALLDVPVAELASIAIGRDFAAPRDRITVFTDINELALHPLAPDGEGVLDHSLAIDASSDPGFTLTRWDVVQLPTTPGDRVLALTRHAGDLHEVPIRIVDQVDEIVADVLPVGKPFGDLCVHALSAGETVETYAWTFTGENLVLADSFRADCVSFYDAVPGAKITAKLGDTTAEFVIQPAE